MSKFITPVTLANAGLGVRILLGLGGEAAAVAGAVGAVSTTFRAGGRLLDIAPC